MIKKKIIKVLKKNGFNVGFGVNCIEIQQYTPAGEDWWLSFLSVEDIKSYCENYNPEEDFNMWVEAKQQGTTGIPSIPELWEDQLWKQKLLNKILEEVECVKK